MKPLVSVGCVLAVKPEDEAVVQACEEACHHLSTLLSDQFPQFEWAFTFVQRNKFDPRGALAPLPLLELGVQEKVEQNWDFALVIVPNELQARDRPYTVGVPSSALEVAVISMDLLHAPLAVGEQLAALALHLLGHLWGLEHEADGPMQPPEDRDALHLRRFPEPQQIAIVDRLEEVADARLEEQRRQWGRVAFYWHAFRVDPKGILTDIWGYRPWKLPVRMGRVTAAAIVSTLLLLLGAETWEAGVNFPIPTLVAGTIAAIVSGTLYVYVGQNLGEISRGSHLREQLARTRIVLFCTLLLGMLVLWSVLYVISFVSAAAMPRDVTAAWSGLRTLANIRVARYAAFMAMLGVLAGALGGNLEEQDAIKAELLYDEET